MMPQESDPFSKYRIKQPQKVTFEEEKPVQDVSQLDKYRISPKQESEDGFFSDFGRHAARTASRVAETIGGIPGDIQDLIQSGVFAGLEALIGNPVTPEMRREAAIKSERAPTSQELKGASETLTKGYTKARSEGEELSDEYASTVASLLGPMKFRKALAISALGVGAKKSSDFLGFDPSTGEMSKIGTMIVSSMVNPSGVRDLWKNYYNQAYKYAPESAYVSAKPLQMKLNRVIKSASEGLESPSELAPLKAAQKLLDKITPEGKISVRQLMASNRSLNELMGDPQVLERGKNLFKEVKKGINSGIKLYHDKDLLKSWNQANEAFAGFHESQKMSRFIQRHVGNKPITHVLLTGLGEAVAGYPEAIIPTAAGAVAAYGGIKGVELIKRIFSNPTLRKYYGDVLLSASKENAVALTKSMEKLDNAIKSMNRDDIKNHRHEDF